MDKPAGRLETIDFAKTQYVAAATVYGHAFGAEINRGMPPDVAAKTAEKAVKEFNFLMNRQYGAQSL